MNVAPNLAAVLSSGDGGILKLIGAFLTAFAAAFGFVRYFVVTVSQDQEALRTWRGRVVRKRAVVRTSPSQKFYTFKRRQRARLINALQLRRFRRLAKTFIKSYGPGIHFIIPFLGGMELMDKRDRSFDLPTIVLELDNHEGASLQYEVKASTIWTIGRDGESLFRVRFGVANLDETVQNICANALREFLPTLGMNITSATSAEVTTSMVESTREELATYGVVLKRIVLNEIARTHGQVMASALGSTTTKLAAAHIA